MKPLIRKRVFVLVLMCSGVLAVGTTMIGATRTTTGAISGTVSILTRDGTTLTPKSAVVYLMYWGQTSETSTAGGAFLAEATRVATVIAEETARNKDKISQEPKAQRLNEFQEYRLKAIDAGLQAAKTWAADNSRDWQFSIVEAPDGRWNKPKVSAGRYKIVVRGQIGDLDAEWEGELSVAPQQTATLDLNRLTAGRRVVRNNPSP